MKLEGS